jgi:hypothetical protein
MANGELKGLLVIIENIILLKAVFINNSSYSVYNDKNWICQQKGNSEKNWM